MARLIVFALTALFYLTSEASADCGFPEGIPCPKPAYETVLLEHQDRIARLKRLAEGRTGFEFYTDTIAKEEHGLADYPVDIPVLRVVADQALFFDSGSDFIRPEAWPLLDIIAKSLKNEPPDVSVFIAGHTDNQGDEKYNYELGLRRAQSVAEALVRRGSYQAEVYRLSFGEAVPIADNSGPNGRARNRRVEFLFAARTIAIVKQLEKQKVTLCAEKAGDKLGDCKIPITFSAQKVEVSREDKRKVLELEKEVQEIRANPAIGQVEMQEQLQRIEVKRKKIPVTISQVRIPVVITPSPRSSVE